MQQLHQQGHQHIAYLGVEDKDYTSGYLRHQAYLAYCEQQNLPARSIQGKLGYDWAYQHIAELLSFQCSAILYATDTQAIGVVKYLQANQLQHIQVAAVCNNPLLHFLFPNVMRVDLGFSQVGDFVVEQLLSLLKGQSVQHLVVKSHLI